MSYGLYCGRLRQRLDRAWCALHWYVPLASRSPAFPWRSQEVYVAAAARRDARLTGTSGSLGCAVKRRIASTTAAPNEGRPAEP